MAFPEYLSPTLVTRSAEAVAACDLTVSYDRLAEVLPQADWLILCCPASPLTRGIANAAAFAAMPTGSHFVNVARGEIAVEADVIAALASGKLAGAYLDVFEREPLDPASPLRLEGVLTQSTASEDMAKGQAALAVHITLTRAGKPVLAKDYRVESTWRSDFIGAIAIPEAQRQFNALFALLVRKVLTDPELIAAARSG